MSTSACPCRVLWNPIHVSCRRLLGEADSMAEPYVHSAKAHLRKISHLRKKEQVSRVRLLGGARGRKEGGRVPRCS